MRDFLRLDDPARRQGWSLIVLNLDFDSSNATGRLVRAIVVVTATVGAFGAGMLAALRHRGPGWFAVAGLLLGPIGVMIAAFAEDGDDADARRREQVSERLAAHRQAPSMGADGR